MSTLKKPALKLKLAIVATIFTAVAFLFLFFYIGINNRRNSYNDSKLIAQETSRKAAIEAETYLSAALTSTRVLAQKALIFKRLGGDRQEITKMILETLNQNSDYLAVWTLWEPNAYDGKDKSFIGDSLCDENGTLGIGFFKYKNEVIAEVSTPNDYSENYYAIPRSLGTDVILEPYNYVYHNHNVNFYETSVIVPIIENSKFLGVFGIDLNLKRLQEKLNSIKLFKSGYLSLISNEGVIISHPDTSLIDKNIKKLGNSFDSIAVVSIKQGKELIREKMSNFSNEKVFRFYYPIKISNLHTPWSMMVEIPIEEATTRSKQMLYVALITLIVGLSLIIYLIFNIIDRKYYEKTIINALEEVKKSNEIVSESERNYRTIYNSTNEAIFIHHGDNGKILDVNDASLNMFGFENKNELLACSVADLSLNQPPYTENEARIFLDKALKEGPQIFEWQQKRKNGEIFWSEVSLKKSNISGHDRILSVIRDISDRKRIENELQESQIRYKTLIETSQNGISLMDLEGKLLYINNKKVEMIGAKNAEQVLGTDALNLLPEENRDKMSQLFLEIIRKGYINNLETEVLRCDGTVFTAEFNVNLVRDKNEKPLYLMSTMRDITERKLALKIIKESEEKYRTLLENMDEAVMVFDNDDRIQYVNRRFKEKLGYESDEIIGKIGFTLLANESDIDIIHNAASKRALDKNYQYELTFKSKSGKEIIFLTSGASLKNADGLETGSIIALVDITERKKGENALKESEQRYKTLLEGFPDIIMVSDLNGNIIYGNEALERITGITEKDYKNPNRKAKIHPDDLPIVRSTISNLVNSNNTQSKIIDNRFIDTWGKTHWFRGIIAKIYLNDELMLQMITRDITEIKKNEEELEKYRNHLEMLVKERTDELEAMNEELSSNIEELNAQREELEATLDSLQRAQDQLIQSEKMASLGVLAAGVAHEINNPLNFISAGIGGIESYISYHFNDHIANIEPLIDGVKEGVRRSAAIVDSLKHYSSSDELSYTSCNLHSIIDNCLIMLNNQLKHRITVDKQFTDQAFLVNGNEGKLHQAILNILTNSIHAIEDKGSIEVSTQIKDSIVTLYIKDSGQGIDSEVLPKIMDPFFTTKDPGKGTGLGLSITYKIIKEHAGTLEYKSIKGKGTLASVTLPIII